MRRHLLTGHDADVARFVAELSPLETPVWHPPFWGFGILNDSGTLIAGVVVSSWRAQFKTCEVSGVAISNYSVDTRIVEAIYGGFIFGQLGAYRVFARTETSNRRAKRLLKHIGFIEEAVQGHHYGPGRHASCWRLIKPEWEQKWGSVPQQVAA